MGKNYIENSLKRFLKRKVKITMGFVVAFMITGSVGFAENINKENETLNMSGYEEILKVDNISIITKTEANKGTGVNNKGILFDSSGTIANKKIIANDITININHDWANGIVAYHGANLDIKANKIDIDAVSEHTPTKMGSGWDTNIVYGIRAEKANASNGGIINIEADTVDVFAKATGLVKDEETGEEVPNYAYGISTATRNHTEKDIVSEINIKAKNTIIKVEAAKKEYATGIVAWSKGKIAINDGNLYVEAGKAISARGNSIVEINKNKNKDYTVVLNGDILFEYGSFSTTSVDADVTVNLTNNQSKFTGKINFNITSGDPNDDKLEYTGMKLGLSNGGTWENTGDSFVNELTLNNGVIDNKTIESDIKVDKLLGTGGAVNMAAVIDETTGTAKSGKITIDNIEKENVKLDVNFKNTGTVEAYGNKAQEYFEKLAENIKTNDTDSKITGTAALDEGFVSGGYEADITINKDGSKVENVTYTGLNSMVEGMRDLATINLLTWRQEMNSLNKRMGELRNSTGEHGVWSRVYTGKIENGSKYDNDYQTYQVGYDKKYTVDNGVMFVGGLVSYTDGETDYALGHGKNYSVGAGIYATWLNNDGQFADVVLKQSRLHNKFDVRSKDLDKSQSGDYNNWGTSLSGQYGRRFDLNDKFFVEPSVELRLGRVDDTTYTTSAGVDVHQDTMYSLVGNIGTSVGYKFSDKGNVYARAALVKEFQGDIDTEYEKDGALERTSEDLGDTWAEFGVGVNYRFVENMNVYVDIQKTGEATVDNKWQANLGFRYEF